MMLGRCGLPSAAGEALDFGAAGEEDKASSVVRWAGE